MREALCLLAASASAWLGFALLALSQERHFERVYASNRRIALTRRAQRAMGFIAIGSSLPCCIASQGASFGSLLWVLLISAAAFGVAFLLTWRPRWLARVLHPFCFFFITSGVNHVSDAVDRFS